MKILSNKEYERIKNTIKRYNELDDLLEEIYLYVDKNYIEYLNSGKTKNNINHHFFDLLYNIKKMYRKSNTRFRGYYE